jgi:hypothetical protein
VYVRRVCGFDHAELDAQQQLWHTHMYPYKLSAYQYTTLTEAVTLGVLNYSSLTSAFATADSEGQVSTELDLMSGDIASTAMTVKHSGSCDGIAVWVDYELTPGNFLRGYENNRFAHHLTVNIKFLLTPRRVLQVGNAVHGRVVFNSVKSDFDYEFTIA